MEEQSNPFMKAGIALLVIGIIDIGVMIYCIVNMLSYSSSFNIFAVIAGIFLMKGGIKTARVIRWLSVLLIICFTAMLLLMPFTMPMDLFILQIKQNPFEALWSNLLGFAFIGILIWLYAQLSSPKALEVIGQAGYSTAKPLSAIYVAAIFIAMGGFLFFAVGNDASKIAKSLAKEQLGSNYSYHTASFQVSGNHGAAVVTAYNSSEIKNIKVKW